MWFVLFRQREIPRFLANMKAPILSEMSLFLWHLLHCLFHELSSTKWNNHDHYAVFLAFIWVNTSKGCTFEWRGPVIPPPVSILFLSRALHGKAPWPHKLTSVMWNVCNHPYLAHLVLSAKASSGRDVPCSLHCPLCNCGHPCHHRLSNIRYLLFGLLSHWGTSRAITD